MKKMLVVAAIALAATLTNASTVDWTSTGFLYDGAATSAKVTSGPAVYLMMVTSTFTQDNLVAAFVDAKGDAAATFAAMQVSGALATGSNAVTALAKMTGSSEYTMTSDMDAYAVVFNGDAMFISNAGTMVYDNVSNSASGTLGSLTADSKKMFADATSYQGAGWYEAAAVPEPTSALMLLVGLAGLALKRKVA